VDLAFWEELSLTWVLVVFARSFFSCVIGRRAVCAWMDAVAKTRAISIAIVYCLVFMISRCLMIYIFGYVISKSMPKKVSVKYTPGGN
jgi:uncharacterized membrane protein YraQ (UPF0718 family)